MISNFALFIPLCCGKALLPLVAGGLGRTAVLPQALAVFCCHPAQMVSLLPLYTSVVGSSPAGNWFSTCSGLKSAFEEQPALTMWCLYRFWIWPDSGVRGWRWSVVDIPLRTSPARMTSWFKWGRWTRSSRYCRSLLCQALGSPQGVTGWGHIDVTFLQMQIGNYCAS